MDWVKTNPRRDKEKLGVVGFGAAYIGVLAVLSIVIAGVSYSVYEGSEIIVYVEIQF